MSGERWKAGVVFIVCLCSTLEHNKAGIGLTEMSIKMDFILFIAQSESVESLLG